MTHLDLAAIRETLAGYAAANYVIETERIQRLANMTDTEARAIDRDLFAGWTGLPPWTRAGLDRLDLFQLESLLAMRQAFAKMAEAQNRT
jgi:hypothetical protein